MGCRMKSNLNRNGYLLLLTAEVDDYGSLGSLPVLGRYLTMLITIGPGFFNISKIRGPSVLVF
jgi:hypothetical protein